MNKQDRELLLKDLCARLPYKVKVYGNFQYTAGGKIFDDKRIEVLDYSTLEELKHGINVKPYLRPMSSMTKKEEKEYSKYAHFGNTLGDWTKSIDYLNSHHFDFRNLIPMGLALPATDGMYNF